MTRFPRFTPRVVGFPSGLPGTSARRHSREPRDRTDSVRQVDVRIGVTQAPRELNIELPDDTDRDDLKARVEAALAGASDVLWVTDKRGKDVGIPAAKIAYIELGSSDGDRRIGFGG
jgi:Protein of unknown function (DUF3107)